MPDLSVTSTTVPMHDLDLPAYDEGEVVVETVSIDLVHVVDQHLVDQPRCRR